MVTQAMFQGFFVHNGLPYLVKVDDGGVFKVVLVFNIRINIHSLPIDGKLKP